MNRTKTFCEYGGESYRNQEDWLELKDKSLICLNWDCNCIKCMYLKTEAKTQ